MNDDDDDLPLLTQVLRTGSRAVPIGHGLDAAGFPSTAADLHAEHSVPDHLVIGSEPWMEPDVASSSPDAAATSRSSPANDLWIDRAPDSFNLPQDHEPHEGSRPADTLGEPDIAPGGSAPYDPLEFDRRSPRLLTLADLGPADRAALESRLRESVLDDLRARIDPELDARIAQALHAEIEVAVAELQSHLRRHLAEALRDVVARAVEEEMVRMTIERPDNGLR